MHSSALPLSRQQQWILWRRRAKCLLNFEHIVSVCRTISQETYLFTFQLVCSKDILALNIYTCLAFFFRFLQYLIMALWREHKNIYNNKQHWNLLKNYKLIPWRNMYYSYLGTAFHCFVLFTSQIVATWANALSTSFGHLM